MNTLHIKKGDSVVVLSGESKGKSGKVLRTFPKRGMVLIEGVNIVKRHEKPRKSDQKGQIVEKTMPINASKVRLAEKKVKKEKKAPKKEAK